MSRATSRPTSNSLAFARSSVAGTGNRTANTAYQLVFQDLHVTRGKKTVINGVSGVAEPGRMLALMGPSGAGKSTLLNVLAGRSPPLTSGSVCLNGQLLTKKLKRKISYVLQEDIFFSHLTVRETLTYAALLKLPESMPSSDKQARIDEIVDALDMRKSLDTVIGDQFKKGISGGEKKRTSIACELLTNPSLLMLDEPTSGLDSNTAYMLMQALQAYSQISRKTVVASIHQPSSQMFFMFDRVLLLCDGQMAYFGDSTDILSFFSNLGLHCEPNYNPADFILEKIKETESIRVSIINAAAQLRDGAQWPEVLKKRHEALEFNSASSGQEDEASLSEVNMAKGHSFALSTSVGKHGRQNAHLVFMKQLDSGLTKAEPDLADSDFEEVLYRKDYDAKWPTSFRTQFNVLARRNFKQALPRMLSKLNIAQSLILSLFCGIIWFQLDQSEDRITERLGVCFFMTTNWAFTPSIDAVLSFPLERRMMNKERAAGYYRLSAFYFGKMVSELPLLLVLPSVFMIIVYWMAGLNGYAAFFKSWALVLLAAFTSQSVGLFVGATVLDVQRALTSVLVFTLCSMLAGGFYVQAVPAWADWFKYLSYLYYAFSGYLTFEFYDSEIRCLPMNETTYCAAEYHKTMNINAASSEMNATTAYFPGQRVLTSMDLHWDEWAYPLVLTAFSFTFRLLAYLVLRFLRKPY